MVCCKKTPRAAQLTSNRSHNFFTKGSTVERTAATDCHSGWGSEGPILERDPSALPEAREGAALAEGDARFPTSYRESQQMARAKPQLPDNWNQAKRPLPFLTWKHRCGRSMQEGWLDGWGERVRDGLEGKEFHKKKKAAITKKNKNLCPQKSTVIKK